MRRNRLYTTTIYGKPKWVGNMSQGVAVFGFTKYHYFEKAKAWGIDEEVIGELAVRKCKKIEASLPDGSRITSTFKNFMQYSWVHTFPNFMPRRFMATDRWTAIPAQSREDREKELLMGSI